MTDDVATTIRTRYGFTVTGLSTTEDPQNVAAVAAVAEHNAAERVRLIQLNKDRAAERAAARAEAAAVAEFIATHRKGA